MIDKLQKEYDVILNEVYCANNKKKELIKKIEKEGFAVFKNKVKENKKVLGAFYNLEFYSHFDGHASDAIYYYFSGAVEITKENFDLLKSTIDEYKGKDNSNLEFYSIIDVNGDMDLPEQFWDSYNFIEHFEIVNDKLIEWNYKGSSDQSELCNDSTVTFKVTTDKTIKSTKTVEDY